MTLEQELARNSQRCTQLESENYKMKNELSSLREEANRKEQYLAQIRVVRTPFYPILIISMNSE